MSGRLLAAEDVVIVYRDGTVGLRAVPKEWIAFGGFREPEPPPPPLSWLNLSADPPTMLSIPVRSYRVCSKMFDGRLIFCEDPFLAEEVGAVGQCERRDLEPFAHRLHDQIERLCDERLAFELDRTREQRDVHRLDRFGESGGDIIELRLRRKVAFLCDRVLTQGVLRRAEPADWNRATPIERKLFTSRLNRQRLAGHPACRTCGFPGIGAFCEACALEGR